MRSSVNGKLTAFETFSHVFFNLNTELLVNAEHICRTPLKLCKHLDMSATAAHFSIVITLAATLFLRMISDATSCDSSLNLLVIKIMWGAFMFLSSFIQARPKNSLLTTRNVSCIIVRTRKYNVKWKLVNIV